MNKREFIKKSSLGALGVALAPSFLQNLKTLGPQARLRTAHIGLGYQGIEDLRDIASHPQVEVVALCDVDSNNLLKALALHPGAKGFKDYRTLLAEMKDQIDAVVVATPDHSHAPVSMMAMEMFSAPIVSGVTSHCSSRPGNCFLEFANRTAACVTI